MAEKLRVQIFADGRIAAETKGAKGRDCIKYMELLEELLEAEIVDSDYTSEFFEEVEQEKQFEVGTVKEVGRNE